MQLFFFMNQTDLTFFHIQLTEINLIASPLKMLSNFFKGEILKGGNFRGNMIIKQLIFINSITMCPDHH